MSGGAAADDLAKLRAAIDGVDDQILALLDRRAEVVREVGRHKRERREAFHVPQRERAVLARLTAAANGAFPREAVRPVFREIMSACLSLESPLVVAYPGPEATFSHLAGKTRFGLSALYRPAASLGEVFREVGRGVDYGVVPVEEASEGLVTHALDHFIDSDLLVEAVGGAALVAAPSAAAAAAMAREDQHAAALAPALAAELFDLTVAKPR